VRLRRLDQRHIAHHVSYPCTSLAADDGEVLKTGKKLADVVP
jgi:hypothetical protein